MGLILINCFGGLPFPWLLVDDCRPTPTSCLPLARVVISFLGCIPHLPVFFTAYNVPSVPLLWGRSHFSWPHVETLHRVVGAGISNGSWHMLTVVSCQPAGGAFDSRPGIPLDCSPQTLGQEVAVRRDRQRLDVGMEGAKREAMSWRHLADGLERDSF